MATKKKTIRERLKGVSDIIGAITVIATTCIGVGTWFMTTINKSTNAKIDDLAKQVSLIQRDTTRTQLLTLINTSPNNEEEIIKVAQYYFNVLDGDWYMTSIFAQWAESRGYTMDELIFMKEATK